jgi:phage shock protein PspC (stress-responsive transcriptional regulator)
VKPCRSQQDRVIAGVCGGIAHELGWPVDRTRIAFLVLSLMSVAFPRVLVYAVLWFVMPETDES